jgi:dTDP-4-dehydrorhamnose 3,5-epimerase
MRGMKVTRLEIPEVLLIEPDVFEDGRGFFFESYHARRFAEHGIPDAFVQDNHSRSAKGVLRGLHFQTAPHEQAKLVRVVRGEVFDVAVDLRPGSPTRGRHVSVRLDGCSQRMLYIPAGFAHGFLSLEDGTDFVYKCTDFYSRPHDTGILWSDPDLAIAWPDPGVPILVSEKDRLFPRLKDLRR